MPNRDLWRPSFCRGLHLVSRAVARLPYGVAEPILGGASAVELYTGGLLMSANFTLLTPNASALSAELLKEGFRWTDRLKMGARGLWHPTLELGVQVTDVPRWESRKRPNILTVHGPFIRLPSSEVVGTTIRVVGIEDLIAAEVTGLASGFAMGGEAAERIEMLLDLGRAGVGGRFRAGYLQRRLAFETKGEIVLELMQTETRLEDLSPRVMTLPEMWRVIDVWRALRGLPFDPRGPTATKTSEQSRTDPARREPRNRGVASPIASNVVYLDDLL